MIVRRRDGEWMIIKHAWHERANNKVVSLKCLMCRWRLMDSARDRLKVFDVKYPRIEITIPANDIKGMVIQNVLTQPIPHFDVHFKLATLCVGLQVFRQPNVALRIRRMFEHLTKFIPITLWRFDL